MENGKIKATIIKCVTAVLCTAIAAGSCVLNTNKICENRLKLSSGVSAETDNNTAPVDEDFEAQFSDIDDSEVPSDAEDFSADDTASDNTDTTSLDSTSASSEKTTSSSGTKKTSEKTKKQITLTGGLSSTDKEEILEYYKLVSNKNKDLLFTKTLTLVSLNGGKNISQKMIDIFLPIAQKALEKNTIDNEPYPGKPDKIEPSDWQAAKAVNDGTYTTLYIKVVPQTDGYNGSIFEGTCGRSMSVLDGIDRALQEMSMVSVDFSTTKMTIEYQNPTIQLKVKNSTGELVKGGCEWKYRTCPKIEAMDVKIIGFNLHLEGAGGNVDYSVKY